MAKYQQSHAVKANEEAHVATNNLKKSSRIELPVNNAGYIAYLGAYMKVSGMFALTTDEAIRDYPTFCEKVMRKWERETTNKMKDHINVFVVNLHQEENDLLKAITAFKVRSGLLTPQTDDPTATEIENLTTILIGKYNLPTDSKTALRRPDVMNLVKRIIKKGKEFDQLKKAYQNEVERFEKAEQVRRAMQALEEEES